MPRKASVYALLRALETMYLRNLIEAPGGGVYALEIGRAEVPPKESRSYIGA